MLETPEEIGSKRKIDDTILLREWIESWQERTCSSDAHEYVSSVNFQYDQLANRTSSKNLVELRLMRSLWAKRIIKSLVLECCNNGDRSDDLEKTIRLLQAVRGFLPDWAALRLFDCQQRIGNDDTAFHLSQLLADFSCEEACRTILPKIDVSGIARLRMGPPVLKHIRPLKKVSKKFNTSAWMSDENMSAYEFVDGNPDFVRCRGIEFHSGDIGIVQLNHHGEGITESFLESPGVAPHAMLFVTRLVRDVTGQKTLYQPSVVEIFEGGWRCVPLSTALNPKFSWYSEWVRPSGLEGDVGRRLSDQLDKMEKISFDFQARRIPKGGVFPQDWGMPSASCSSFIRIPFERANIASLPYPLTPVNPIALENLERIGIFLSDGIYTPTNILNDSGFQKVGIVDNGFPESAYAQALVVGRPDMPHTFGGMLSNRRLRPEKLPDWHRLRHWRSAWEALKISLGQSEGFLGSVSRTTFGFDRREIPMSASSSAIAFYVRSDQEAGWIVKETVQPLVSAWLTNGKTSRFYEMSVDRSIIQTVRDAIGHSALELEGWYDPN